MFEYAYLFFIPAVITGSLLFYFLLTRKLLLKGVFLLLLELVVLVLYPIIFLLYGDAPVVDCCDSMHNAFIAPGSKLSIYVLMGACVLAYFYAKYVRKPAGPLFELVIYCLLLLGILANIPLILHLNDSLLALMGIAPVMGLFALRLILNHYKISKQVEEGNFRTDSGFYRWMYDVLVAPMWKKIPLLTILCIPLLLILMAILLLFGQKPDAFITAFTETYGHGLSQLACEVNCADEHYLCTIAAKGHKQVVKPLRYGVRHGRIIQVNRQLLVANAFEDLLEQKMPKSHHFIRHHYNQFGERAKRLFLILGNPWIADIVYLIMKPLDWFFRLVLYFFESKPENSIAIQYLYPEHRQQLEKTRHS
ncbi:MAG: hypothetical protein DHS20C18_43210 [Saprospiraceae bacterium]|nr:MAG: hypothetical protein DHS20C18_43210 [Saprospiraceae bacterium]